MNSFKQVTKNIHRFHWRTLERMTNSYMLTTYSLMEEKFYQYYYKQLGMDDFENKLIEFKKAVDQKTEEVQTNFKTLFGLNINFNWEITRRIDGRLYYFNQTLIEEYKEVLAPLQKTSQLLTRLDGFPANESPQVLGANWKLQKLFPMFKATKKVNPDFILLPEVVEEFVNSYFLYIQFGGEPLNKT